MVQSFVEMSPDSSEVILFCRTDPYYLMAMPHMETEETSLNDETKKQACVTMA